MSRISISIPAKWEQYLKQLADDHQVDLNRVIGELCEWAFSNLEGKKQFELWLDDAFPPKGEAEDKAQDAGARERSREENMGKKSPKKKLMKTKTTTRTSPERTSTVNSIPKLPRSRLDTGFYKLVLLASRHNLLARVPLGAIVFERSLKVVASSGDRK